MGQYHSLSQRIKTKKAVVTVMGLGYVGLPIALEFASKKFKVYGLDIDASRVRRLKKGQSYINDIPDREVDGAIKAKRFIPVSDSSVISDSDVVIVCVPTPLRKTKDPDISYVLEASKTLSENLRPGQIVILESTTYPGTTRELILPELEKSGLALDEDFFLAFSPERIDPGNERYGFSNIPKVLGGISEKSTRLGKSLYSMIIKKVVPVSSCEAAEVSKLLENTFRLVNIGLINEFAMLCDKLGIDVWEVIDAAATKPFGFMPFYPGPGIGGHCIPADPIYLSWKARNVGFRTNMVDLAAEINRMLPAHVVKRAGDLLREKGIRLSGARVLICGAAYKKDVNDLRESPALEVIELLRKKKADVVYHDPYIPVIRSKKGDMRSRKLTSRQISCKDIVIVITDHSDVDYDLIAGKASLILDTRNIFAKRKIKGENINNL